MNAGGALVQVFRVAADLGTVTWAVEFSADLLTFSTAVNGQNGVTIATAPSGTAGYNLVTVTVPNPSSGAPLFGRLRVTLP